MEIMGFVILSKIAEYDSGSKYWQNSSKKIYRQDWMAEEALKQIKKNSPYGEYVIEPVYWNNQNNFQLM